MAKTKGRKLYEADLAQKPNYQATGKPRPQWEDLAPIAQDSWSRRGA